MMDPNLTPLTVPKEKSHKSTILSVLILIIVIVLFVLFKDKLGMSKVDTGGPMIDPVTKENLNLNKIPESLPQDLPVGKNYIVTESSTSKNGQFIQTTYKYQSKDSFAKVSIDYDQYFHKNAWVFDGATTNKSPDYIYFSSQKGSDHFMVTVNNGGVDKTLVEVILVKLNRPQ